MRTTIESFARFFARSFVRIYYHHVEVTGSGFIPRQGPVLLVANHANSLIDPVMVGMAARRGVRFFAKAPLFETPLLGPLMHALGMLPAFRGQDGSSQVRRNLESLQVGVDALVAGCAVGIFPEGKSHDSLQLEQIRSGAARMAVQAARNGAPDLVVVPVGINYECKERFRSAVWLRVGEPLHVASVLPDADDKAAMRAVTAEIDKRLKEVVLHLSDASFAPFLHELELLLPQRKLHHRLPISVIHQRKRIADAMNYFLVQDRPRAERMAEDIRAFEARLSASGLDGGCILLRRGGMAWLLARTAWLLAAAPVALAGAAFHLLPFTVTRLAARKVIQGSPTIALSRLGLGLPIYGAWYAGAWFILNGALPLWATWLTLGLLPVAGVIALVWCYRARLACRDWPHACLALTRRETVAALRAEQARLQQALRAFSDEYEKVSPPGADARSSAAASTVSAG